MEPILRAETSLSWFEIVSFQKHYLKSSTITIIKKNNTFFLTNAYSKLPHYEVIVNAEREMRG